MSISNPTKKEKRIYSIFSAGQLDKLLDEIGTAPLPTKWDLESEDEEWKEYVSELKYLKFEEEISHEEIEKLLGPARFREEISHEEIEKVLGPEGIEKVLGPAARGAGDRQFMLEGWDFDAFSDDKYNYIFCVDISFVGNVAALGIAYWKKTTRYLIERL